MFKTRWEVGAVKRMKPPVQDRHLRTFRIPLPRAVKPLHLGESQNESRDIRVELFKPTDRGGFLQVDAIIPYGHEESGRGLLECGFKRALIAVRIAGSAVIEDAAQGGEDI